MGWCRFRRPHLVTEAPGLLPGALVWVAFDPVTGREQGGLRPAVVVSGAIHLQVVTTLVTVVPVTSVDRGWENHLRIRGQTGLPRESFAMTEQVRTIARARVHRVAGTVDHRCLTDIRRWVVDFLSD
ncbi:type II toxin-antitoxin system PemK/MazF family toxin [Ruania rhizosphaerae]|uniref:type II toxin-antitoxin system PemK/MazF family toxin n=1 Tax=Ruania rhizosphaerae TaxID=1840413 RepID=UPI00135C4BDA|nr:type II toxin-antitoxin system PemK/MazF family toxin [Ruania rhizosphaerae]